MILILLIFIVGPKYLDSPEEYGIAVNFGTTDFGSGKVQLKEPINNVKVKLLRAKKLLAEIIQEK